MMTDFELGLILLSDWLKGSREISSSGCGV
jgi:hypothetical protein